MTPSNSTIFFIEPSDTPDFWVRMFAPTVGAELFLFNHGNLDISADFLPARIDHPPASPASLAAFQRRRTSVTAAFRIFF